MSDKSKQYRTRDGREVRIYATDGSGDYPVHGAVRYAGSTVWVPVSWTVRGKRVSECEDVLDLIEIKPRIKRTIWVRLYDSYCTHSSVEPVDPSSDCLACVKVEIDCEHGEGLSND